MQFWFRLPLWGAAFSIIGMAFAFLTVSCSGPCSLWRQGCAVGSSGSYNSARLFLPPANEFSGLELEFVRMQCGLRLYINVYGLQIPPEDTDATTSRVYISFKDYAFHFSAARFQGGQRLLIPEDVQMQMLDYLQEGRSVFLQVGRYQADIYPDKFVPLFQSMMDTPI